MQANSFGRAAVQGHHPWFQRWSPGRASALLSLALLALLLSGCLTDISNLSPTATAQPTLPPGVFPAFGDWRLAYIGLASRLHIISLDGKTDLSGLVLPDGLGAIAPDGRAAIISGGVLNLRSRTPDSQIIQTQDAGNYAWSPDSVHVVFEAQDAQANFYWAVLDITTGKSTSVLGDRTATYQGYVIGWIDTTHLAVWDRPANSSTITLSSLNTTTGALRKIANISTDGLGSPVFSLAPDGSEILLTNYAGEGDGEITLVEELINTSTGQKRRLPTILSVTGGGIGFIWKPGTQLAVTTGNPSYLLDLANDTATPFAADTIPLGWAPDTGMLYVATRVTGPDTFEVSAMAAPPPATATQPLFRFQGQYLPDGYVRSA